MMCFCPLGDTCKEECSFRFIISHLFLGYRELSHNAVPCDVPSAIKGLPSITHEQMYVDGVEVPVVRG